jgi:hypothetical protein
MRKQQILMLAGLIGLVALAQQKPPVASSSRPPARKPLEAPSTSARVARAS